MFRIETLLRTQHPCGRTYLHNYVLCSNKSCRHTEKDSSNSSCAEACVSIHTRILWHRRLVRIHHKSMCGDGCACTWGDSTHIHMLYDSLLDHSSFGWERIIHHAPTYKHSIDFILNFSMSWTLRCLDSGIDILHAIF